ncbi:hypothetical protein V3C99_007649 [Haemonchus contortus]
MEDLIGLDGYRSRIRTRDARCSYCYYNVLSGFDVQCFDYLNFICHRYDILYCKILQK